MEKTKKYLTIHDVLEDEMLDSGIRRDALGVYGRAKEEFEKQGVEGMSCEDYRMKCVNSFFELKERGRTV